ncbi:helix-turn-helix transcriptional regulator [Nocardia sp. NPDC051052]|uniref:helix-turn-helix transcriptional regulator n=1 Tax=Nocardia sp. NPDC051052 TaxID=3364322 RepID=UPI0037B55740
MAESDHEPLSLLEQRMYTTGQVSRILGVDASTLRRWRRGTPVEGPGFVRISERVAKYPESDLEAYLEARHIKPVA